MQTARHPLGRVARGALFAAGAVAISECSSFSPQPLYGAVCANDACTAPQQDAAADASDASDASALDAAKDATPDAPEDATID